ncbi:MAG: formyltetrahydrofolate deformylase [Betaproteobacteria bacterium]|nr:formyltetrahydrofolate deformylase [Betaproteobacteria bacterium]
MNPAVHDFVLTLACADAKGIVYSVSGVLYQAGCNILDSQQFGDPATGLFFMRVHFAAPPHLDGADKVELLFADLRQRFAMQADIHALARRPRVLIAVSRQAHCLNDLLFRWRAGQMPMDVVGVVSNHADCAALAAHYEVAFHHEPLAAGADAATKRAQEQRIEALMREQQVELLVLARYMQILSPQFCAALDRRAINIHHSFLPSFKGARPYQQAHDRGVKLIGATAHYVTADLDEGPIIEQDVQRVDHSLDAAELTAAGQDVENQVLARAVRWHVEHRILRNGHKTVVFK